MIIVVLKMCADPYLTSQKISLIFIELSHFIFGIRNLYIMHIRDCELNYILNFYLIPRMRGE